ncbi:MAG: hypothetical protein LBG60_08520 [Bifidobacteriaceae bacterium]|nr:hypothetical protein [Bifidobacteriaceae bacterium]
MVVPTNVRIPEDVDAALRAYSAAVSVSRSALLVRALREWLEMQKHPRIRFAPGATGERRAALVDGPEVWSVAESWLQHPPEVRSVASVADAVGLAELQVEAALAYWADHRAEIDGLLGRIHAAQDAALAEWEGSRAFDRPQ